MTFTTFGVPPARPEPILTGVTESGNNTASTAWGISYPALSNGDLVIFGLVSDAAVTHGTLPTGPNGETAQTISYSTGDTNQKISVWYWKAAGNATAGTVTIVPSAAEQWTAAVAVVQRENYDSTTPIGGGSTHVQTTDSANVVTDAFTAGATDGGGLLCAWIGVDTDPILTTATGWINDADEDRGAVNGTLSHRTILVSNSESVPAYTWTIAADSSVKRAFIIRAK